MFIGIFAFLPSSAVGQNAFDEYKKKKQSEFNAYKESKQKAFDDYKIRKRKEFDEYRRKKNEEFAKYLEQKWVIMPEKDPIPEPRMPEPVKPTIAPKDKNNSLPDKPTQVPEGEIIPVPVPQKELPRSIPLPLPEANPITAKMNLAYYGLSIPVSMNNNLKFQLSGLSEKDIVKVWDLLSEDTYTPLFDDCAQLIEDLRLNGWGTLKLCQIVGETLEGKGTNESVVLETYLLTQLGYDARLIRVNKNKLLMICPCNELLCRLSFIEISGKKYYVFGDMPSNGTIYSYKNNFDAATLSLDLNGITNIRFNYTPSASKTFTSEWNSNLSVTVEVNKNLVDFYNDMPFIKDWSYYARQKLDRELSQKLMPTLKTAIAGKEELAAANELLHFVQTAFDYQTDEEQFKKEKTDFKEEPFYDSACDCEDRSILFSDFVYTLLHLDVVLLHYPNHLCTAVKFTNDVNGDYIMVNGQKYVICDPTYINASVGSCMPKFKSTKPTIYKIYN